MTAARVHPGLPQRWGEDAARRLRAKYREEYALLRAERDGVYY